jgi:hypothetical protein
MTRLTMDTRHTEDEQTNPVTSAYYDHIPSEHQMPF